MAQPHFWGQEFDDDELLRLNKALMSGAAVLFIPAGLLWSAGYFWLGLTHAAGVPLIGTILLLVGLIYYVRTKDYETFRTYALIQTLLMPFALNWILGGFVNSGLVILWSALTPFASLVLENQRRALRWSWSFDFAGVERLGAAGLSVSASPAGDVPAPVVPDESGQRLHHHLRHGGLFHLAKGNLSAAV